MFPRIKAASIHLILNLFIFTLFILTLRYFWYPEPYFTASGGWQGLKIVALVDVVLGPILTLIVFNPTKPFKELKLDLSIIILLQLSALTWGVHTVYQQRPIANVFWEDSFYTVAYSEVSHIFKDDDLAVLTSNPHALHYIEKPTTIDGIIKINQEIQDKKLPPFQLIKRYQDFEINFDSIKQHSINIDEVIQYNKTMAHDLDVILSKTKTSIEKNIYIKLVSRYQNIILVFSQKGTLLGYLKAPFKDKSQI